VFQNPNWDWRAFDFTRAADRDTVVQRERTLGPILNGDNPDLRAFQKRGGKILHFQGWTDPLAAPPTSTEYYDNVVSMFAAGGDARMALREVQGFYRLFMVPGMVHGLGNGFGPSTFDLLTALENWKEHGKAPDSILATHFNEHNVADQSRPLCPYPAAARYLGSGDVNVAVNFSCRN